MRCENALMTTDETNDALGALLGLALRAFAATPAVPLGADRAGRAGVVRVSAPATDEFTHLLVTVFGELRASLLGQARRKVSSVGGRGGRRAVGVHAGVRPPSRRRLTGAAGRLPAQDRRQRGQRHAAPHHHRPGTQDRDHEPEELYRQADLRFDDRVALRETLLSALVVLAPREHEAIVLRWYGDHTLAQVGRIMGLAENSVKTYVHYGLRKIREYLEKDTALW